MQNRIQDLLNSVMCTDKNQLISKLDEWFKMHRELIYLLTKQNEIKGNENLQEKITNSLNYGENLMKTLSKIETENTNKILIPLSGKNRFLCAKNVLENSSNQDNYNFSEIKNQNISKISCNLDMQNLTQTSNKKIPLPSRTYLKKNK